MARQIPPEAQAQINEFLKQEKDKEKERAEKKQRKNSEYRPPENYMEEKLLGKKVQEARLDQHTKDFFVYFEDGAVFQSRVGEFSFRGNPVKLVGQTVERCGVDGSDITITFSNGMEIFTAEGDFGTYTHKE